MQGFKSSNRQSNPKTENFLQIPNLELLRRWWSGQPMLKQELSASYYIIYRRGYTGSRVRRTGKELLTTLNRNSSKISKQQ